MAQNPSSAIYTPEPIPYSVSPLSRLPVELSLLTFRFCDPDIRKRLRLTHVCRQWRSIAINSASLWTFLRIEVNFRPHSKRSDSVIALLDIQLGRADGLLLDVELIWNPNTGVDPRLLDLIRQKGPFSLWRTLKVGFQGVQPDKTFSLGSCDVFSNLESLVILPSAFNSILETIDRTSTKLRFLELQDSQMTQTVVGAPYQCMMQRIVRLKTFSTDVMSIPRNILELEAGVRNTHCFPHITKYTLILCVFKNSQSFALENLTHLVATMGIMLSSHVEVYFPALQHLTCGALITRRSTKIDAPVLETFRLLPVNGNGEVVRVMTTALQFDRYVFSPTKSITLDAYLPHNTAVTFLEQSPRVEQVSLSFEDAITGEKMLERMEGADNRENGVLEGRLCEKMVELRINLGYALCDLESWKGRASRFVESRRASGSELQVYASWKGEGTYVLLA
jgi:F-box-like